ncbi:MAG TPA: cation:proton antiporter [Candidatus Acidoferrales bacterium]|nr:cation:proton antiporter [Candidatus Acidoferrales bacterium]
MALLLAFAITLVIAVLISGIAEETILSVAVLFLVCGFLLGSGAFGSASTIAPKMLETIAEVALFSVLFTDGMRTGGLRKLAKSWALPTRALLIGMPLTIVGIAVLAHYMARLPWMLAFLIGAALSPTDPVFVSAIFRFEGVPARAKQLLNVESGLNDGLSLAVLIVLLAYGGLKGPGFTSLAGMPLGLAIGFGIPFAGLMLEKIRFFRAAGVFHPLNGFALGLLVLAVSYVTGANLFFAGFGAGISVATFGPSFSESFQEFGELVTELLKLAALLVFGVAIAPQFFKVLPLMEYGFILLAVFVVRIVAIWLAMIGSGLTRREMLLTGWFGPKGFASVVYGILIFRAGLYHAADLVALAVTASIVVYSSTDILIGRWFEKRAKKVKYEDPGPGGVPQTTEEQ